MSTRGRGSRGRGLQRGRGRAQNVTRERLTLTDAGETSGSMTNTIDGEHRDETQVEHISLGADCDPSDTPTDDEVSSVQRRGPNRGTPMPTDEAQRMTIHVVDSKFMETIVTRNITRDVKSILSKPYPSWEKVPLDKNNLLWDTFKARYRWDSITDVDMRKIWSETSASRLSDVLYKARDKARDNFKKQLGREPNTIDLVGRGPQWICKVVWDELVKNYWATEDFKDKSEKARQNRMTEKDGSVTKHTCGSIPRVAHLQKLENKLNRPVDKFELFEHTSKSQKTGDFVDAKSKKISEEYRAKVGCMDSSPPGFDLSVWSNLVGGPSKGRLYGVGRSHIAECHSAASISTPFRGEPNEEISKVDDAIQATISKLEEDFQKKDEEREEAHRRKEEERDKKN